MTVGARNEDEAERARTASTCYLCGRAGASTTEHVLPRCLYPGKLPNDVITARAHGECNAFTSKDEEAFRNHISVAIPPTSPGHALWKKTWKAIHRPEARGMQAEFYGNMLSRLERMESGAMGRSPVVARMKDVRVHRVLAKIVAGLYLDQTGQLLVPVRVRWRFGSARDDQRDVLDLPREMSVHEVLQVRWGYSETDPTATVWVLGFYETVWFWASTMPPTKAGFTKRKRGLRLSWPGPPQV